MSTTLSTAFETISTIINGIQTLTELSSETGSSATAGQ